MKHEFNSVPAPPLAKRRARRHPLAKHPLQSGTTLTTGGGKGDKRLYSDAVNSGSSPQDVLNYVLSTTIIPPNPVNPAGYVDPLLYGIRDAADECKHGRLPGDRTKPCMCWGGA